MFKFCRNAAVKKDIRAPWLYKLFKSRMREHGVSWENMKNMEDIENTENMEKMENINKMT